MKYLALLTVMLLPLFKIRADEPMSFSPRMNLRDFAEYHLYVDENGDGVVNEMEDKRSPEAKRRLESFKKGVRVMKSRKPSDPSSWFFQSAVHGVTDEAIILAADRDPDVLSVQREMFWNRCPHDGAPSADFLVWHRAYLYYFERILRDAADDPTLSLPYWDYTGGDRAFPRPFAVPEIADGDIIPRNPLYSSIRDRAFMVGRTTLSDMVTTLALERLLSETQFFGPTEDTGLAGGVYDSNPGTMGLIERRPHNDLHVAIGGVIGDDLSGLMAEVQTAAFDPIFWVHHANIDRIFAKWDRLPDRSWGYFPNASWFVERPWYFYDVDGSVQNNQRAHYLVGKNLGVSFDDVDSAAQALTDSLPFELNDTGSFLATLSRNFEIDPKTGKTTSKVLPMCDCCRKKTVEAVLSAESSTEFTLNVVGSVEASQKMMSATPRFERPQREPQTMLEVSFLPPATVPNVGFEVLLEITTKDDDKPKTVSVGNLSMFGARHHAIHSSAKSPTVTQRFNVTEFLGQSKLKPSNFKVVVKPYSLFDDAVKSTARRSGNVSVTNIEITVE
ncbi:MAG: tyrosinase family protein [Pirellulaceae bacterium]|nr:tyrosinase family protein [Pirellulaceae bacterium]